jgi:uncharacterized protein (UPF0276 family)
MRWMRIMSEFRDRIGVGWRPHLAAGILGNLDQIDVVEVIADDFFDANKRERQALQTLAAQVPVVLHGVSLGLASSAPVQTRRLDGMARLIEVTHAEFWSEHLAFVRAGSVEIGHLAAPPRTRESVEGAASNIALARKIVGTQPLVENVATLIDPPGGDTSEAGWIDAILRSSDSDLLLDLHNLYANATNFGFCPKAFINALPADRVGAIHLAGGKFVGTGETRRLLDDHLHNVPDQVYELLQMIGSRIPHPLTVIIERDGNFPSMGCLLDELQRARLTLKAGREELGGARTERAPAGSSDRNAQGLDHASDRAGDCRALQQLESFLATIYIDRCAREKFLADPRGNAIKAGLAPFAVDAVERMDVTGLELLAASLERKRRLKSDMSPTGVNP